MLSLHQITFHRALIFDDVCDSTGETIRLKWCQLYYVDQKKNRKQINRSKKNLFHLIPSSCHFQLRASRVFFSTSSSSIYQVRESMTFETKVNTWMRTRANVQFSWTGIGWHNGLTCAVENECNQSGWNTISRPTPSKNKNLTRFFLFISNIFGSAAKNGIFVKMQTSRLR